MQAVLAAHNTAGEKERTHPHYLKGSVWCGSCGGRLIFSRNTGNGGSYDYFFCLNRQQKRKPCQRRAVRVHAVETGVEDLYRTMQLLNVKWRAIDRQRATQQLTALTGERKAVLQAHYAGAVPLDLLREEMERLTREISEAERLASSASATVDQLEATLRQALAVAVHCHEQYQQAPPHLRRQINQGFFTKLFVDQDGSVERAELTEPFATLLLLDVQQPTAHAEAIAEPGCNETGGAEVEVAGTACGDNTNSPTSSMLAGLFADLESSGDDLVGAGLNKATLVPPAGLEPAT